MRVWEAFRAAGMVDGEQTMLNPRWGEVVRILLLTMIAVGVWR